MFVSIIEAEWASRIPTKDPTEEEPLKSAAAIAGLVADRQVFRDFEVTGE